MKQSWKIICAAAAAGAAGAAGGASYERRRSNPHLNNNDINDNWRLPGLPLRATVSAAAPIAHSVPAAAAGVPAEPPRGSGRAMEVMRFGFPGYDQLNSRKYER